jgi:hypothetical protein
MAGVILNKKDVLKDCNGNQLFMGDEVVFVRYGSGRLVTGFINRFTDASIFIDQHCIRKANCHYQCLKLKP